MAVSLSNSSPGQKSAPEMVVQEYPPCAEKTTVKRSDPGDEVVEVCTGAADILPPPQAPHSDKLAKASTTDATECLTKLPPKIWVQDGCQC
jgi:hypothetical protein